MVLLTAKADFRRDESTREKTVNQYKLGATVGRGTFCKVKWAEDTNGNGYAMKVLSRMLMERRMVAVFKRESGATTIPFEEAIRAELKLLQGLQHNHIISLHEIIDDLEHQDMYIVYEGMVGGDLMNFRSGICGYEVGCDAEIAKKHWGDQLCLEATEGPREGEIYVYTEGIARFLLAQMFEAVMFLHEKGIIHKDLKPDNILLSHPLPASDLRIARKLQGLAEWPKVEDADSTGGVADAASEASLRKLLVQNGLSIKVCDFGCSEMAAAPDCRIYDATGTQLFTPPECFEALHCSDDGILGKPRDMWSLGCTLFNMLYGRCPFWSEDNFGLQLAIIGCEFSLPEDIISMQAMDLIRGLMQKEPGDRLTAVSASQHPFLRPLEPLAPPE